MKKATQFLCIFAGLCTHMPTYAKKPDLHIVREWKQLEFVYPSPTARQDDIDKGIFKPNVPAPIDVDVDYEEGTTNKKGRIFVTIPRFQPGSPAALAVVSDGQLNGNPLLQPYPSWSWHRDSAKCLRDRIVSVYRVKIDNKHQMWVLDTGRLETMVCTPQLLVFDLKTDKLIHRYEIPHDQYELRSIFVTPIVDETDAGTFVYMADVQTFSIVVYDVNKGKSWRVTDKTFYPFPTSGTFSIEGDSFDLMDGILGMDITPRKTTTKRRLFYHALSSTTENWVSLHHLQNMSRFEHNPESSPEIFHTFAHRRSSQSAAQAIDKDRIMYYGTMSNTALNCWNTDYEFNEASSEMLLQNQKELQFLSGMKVINNKKGEQELWAVSSRFQKVATGTLNPAEVNFRILGIKVKDLVYNSKCSTLASTGKTNSYGFRIAN